MFDERVTSVMEQSGVTAAEKAKAEQERAASDAEVKADQRRASAAAEERARMHAVLPAVYKTIRQNATGCGFMDIVQGLRGRFGHMSRYRDVIRSATDWLLLQGHMHRRQ